MIQIEIETMKAAVSELQSKRAILSQIKERMAKLSYAISQQSYVEEQQKPLQTKFVLGYQEKIWLNPRVKELTPIRLKSEGEADE